MTKPEFEKLLQRYLHGECTEDEKIKIQIWFDTIEKNRGFKLSDVEKEQIEEKLSLNINNKIDSNEKPGEDKIPFAGRLNSSLIYLGIAASLMLAIFLIKNEWSTIGNSISNNALIGKIRGNQIINKTNDTEVSERIILEDGSKVYLTSGSSISYRTHFDSNKRIVTLKGTGFFQVTKDAKKPFYVLCRGTVTRVIGTSFWVNTNQKSKSVEIGVKSGKVSVFINKLKNDIESACNTSDADQVYLTPNQRVIFLEHEKKIEKKLVTEPLLLESPEIADIEFIYNQTPLASVINELGKSYGVQIVMADAKLRNCSFTGDLRAMSFDEKIALICESVSAKYSTQGTNITLNGQGCK